MESPQIEDSDSSWTEKRSSAETLCSQNDFEMAMEGYEAAAKAAIDQQAAPRDISKCYTNASQMAWKAFFSGLDKAARERDHKKVKNMSRFIPKTVTFAEDACKRENSWSKASVYLLRGLGFQYWFRKDKKVLERAKTLANDVVKRHFSDLPLSKINNNALWLGLCLVKHPLYCEFILECPGFGVVKFPDQVLYVSRTKGACFNSVVDACNFLNYCGCMSDTSLLLSPGKYVMGGLSSYHLTLMGDVVGNRAHQSLDDLKDDGMKALEGGCSSSDSVVIEFQDEGLLFLSPSCFSRLSFLEMSKVNYTMFKCRDSKLDFNNCFFGSEFKPNVSKSELIYSINSSVSLTDCVMTQAGFAVWLEKSKGVFRNNIVESYNIGFWIRSSSIVEIENVHFRCHTCISSGEGCEVTIKKCVLQEEPHHFIQHAPAYPHLLVDAEKSTMSIHNSIVGSNSCGSDVRLVVVRNSKFIMKNSELNKKDADHVIWLREGANAIIENNKFSFKNQETKNLALVTMDKTDVLDFCENLIQGLNDLFRSGIEVSHVSMPEDGIMPTSTSTLKIQIVSVIKTDAPKLSKDMKHVSIHMDRLGLEGAKKSKAGKRMCHSCSKVEQAGEKSFCYCGQCKIVSYCSKECQTKDWKQGHKEQCHMKQCPNQVAGAEAYGSRCPDCPWAPQLERNIFEENSWRFEEEWRRFCAEQKREQKREQKSD